MSEYIEKEAFLVELRERQEKAKEWLKGASCQEIRVRADAVMRCLAEIKLTLDKLPPADVKPVVYCRECRYAKNTITGECKYCAYWGDMFQTFNKLYLRADFFCAAGEKREDKL